MAGRVVLGAAVLFSVAMGALSSGGWWWVWLAALAVPLLSGRVRLPLLGRVRLDSVTRFILRENAKTRRDNRRIARQRRRRIRDQHRAIRKRRHQPNNYLPWRIVRPVSDRDFSDINKNRLGF